MSVPGTKLEAVFEGMAGLSGRCPTATGGCLCPLPP